SKRLQAHWSSWITQSDFGQIAAAGMNHVRIPIGYWSIVPRDGEPFVGGAYEWLGKALDWANSAGLKVIIDLHGGKLDRIPCGELELAYRCSRPHRGSCAHDVRGSADQALSLTVQRVRVYMLTFPISFWITKWLRQFWPLRLRRLD